MSREAIETFAEIRTPDNPFPGLRPFEFDESHLFFGRDGQSEQLIGKLGRTRFLAVVGTSGSGKSSLVRAGLLPTLLGGFMTSAGSDWRIAIMRPGNNPIGNLAGALNAPDVFGSDIGENAAMQTAIAEATLRRSSLGLVDAVRQAAMSGNENLLVLVDQFEEIFRFARVSEGAAYHNDAAAFVKLNLEASRQREVPIYVVLTMRSDYLGDCSQFWGLPEAINESQYLIPRLTRDQLREAIIGPIAVGGGQIAPRLVNRLLNDVGDDQDQLPILQHALMRTWDQWKGDYRGDESVDLPLYEAIGTMSSALSNHADEAYDELKDERSKEIAEKIFKGLTEKGSDNREIRRPIELKHLCALAEAKEAAVVSVIEVFRSKGRSFLMPPAGVPLTEASLIDISHESLIRNWRRLKEWVEDESRSARIYKRLVETAVLHREGKAGLWRDPDLQIALAWREQNKPNQVWAQRYHPEFALAMSFLDQSVAARDAEIIEKEKQRRKGAKRTRLTAIVFALLFFASSVALIFANQQRIKASAQTEIANAQTVRANAQTERANALLEEVRRTADEAKNSAVAEAEARVGKEQAEKQQRIAVSQSKQDKQLRLVADEQRAEAIKQRGIAEKSVEEALKQETLAKNALVELTEQKRATETALERTNAALEEVRKEKAAAEEARRNTEYARDAANRASESLKNEKQQYASLAAQQETLISSIKDASSAAPRSSGRLRLRLTDVYGERLGERVDIALRSQSGATNLSLTRMDASKNITIGDLGDVEQGIYRVYITPSSYLPATRFVTVKANGISEASIQFAIDPAKVRKVDFPKYQDLPAEAQRLLKASRAVEGNEGKAGEDLYGALDDLQRAGLLNIIAKSQATHFEGAGSVLSYLQDVRRIRGDRIFAAVDRDLRSRVAGGASSRLFSQVPDALHVPPPGFTLAGSFKTPDLYGSLQLTFFRSQENPESLIAEVDIDSGGGLAHVFNVSSNRLTGRVHPYEIQQLLLAYQKIDPGYRLKP